MTAMLALTLLTNAAATENAIATARHQIDTQTLNGIERVEMYLQDRRSGVALTAQLPLVRAMLENQENPEARERGQFVINVVQNTFNYDTTLIARSWSSRCVPCARLTAPSVQTRHGRLSSSVRRPSSPVDC